MNTDASVRVDRNGREGQPVVVIDNFTTEAEALARTAADAIFDLPSKHYPGVRAAVPASLFPALFAPLADLLKTMFGFSALARVHECNFSLVTTPPEALTPIQRLPHFDGFDENMLAVLLYLGPVDFGGTAFYRQKSTGFETVTQQRFETYRAALSAEVAASGLPAAQYIEGSTPLFECINSYEAVFNRALIYRGVNLHCAQIRNADQLSADPKRGRLTLNAFLAPARNEKRGPFAGPR